MAEARLTFFDIMGVINSKSKFVWDADFEKAYEPYMVNRGFSQFADATLYANELNQYPDLDKKLQFDFYYFYLPKARRFSKWAKAEKQAADEKLVVEKFGVARDKASEYIKTLDIVMPNWREELQSELDKGGRRGKA